jgi:hypothetical protein
MTKNNEVLKRLFEVRSWLSAQRHGMACEGRTPCKKEKLLHQTDTYFTLPLDGGLLDMTQTMGAS